MTTLYIGNLPLNCNEEILRKLLEKNNLNCYKIILKKHGYGFASFRDQSTADKAIDALSGMNPSLFFKIKVLFKTLSYTLVSLY